MAVVPRLETTHMEQERFLTKIMVAAQTQQNINLLQDEAAQAKRFWEEYMMILDTSSKKWHGFLPFIRLVELLTPILQSPAFHKHKFINFGSIFLQKEHPE